MDSLSAVATINLWEANYWKERKPLLVDELRKNRFTSKYTVIMACQEVRRQNIYTLEELATELGFSKNQASFFPTIISADFGLGVITNLSVKKQEFVFFSYDQNDPLEFGERGIALMLLEDKNGAIILGVTHLSVSEKMQYIHAVETINAIKNFGSKIFKLQDLDSTELFKNISKKAKIIIAGDFNASPVLPLYQLFAQAGLIDLTLPLHNKYQFTWPPDPVWLENLHRKLFGRKPNFDAKILQRWMDYIWGCGLIPKKALLLGTKQINGMYPSDHFIPAIYF